MHTRTATRTRVAATAAVLAGITLTLAGCGGSDLDGEYFDEYGRLTIDDSSVIYHRFDCEDGNAWVEEEPSASGELGEEHTSIRWASDDEHIAQDSIGGITSLNSEDFDSGAVITITGDQGEYEFTPGDEDEALTTYSERCT